MHSAPAAVLAPTMASHLHHTRNFPHHTDQAQAGKECIILLFLVFEIDLNGFSRSYLLWNHLSWSGLRAIDKLPLCHIRIAVHNYLCRCFVGKMNHSRTQKIRPGMASAFTLHRTQIHRASFPLTLTVCIGVLVFWTSFLVILHIYL